MYLMSENGQKKPSSIAPPLLHCSCKVYTVCTNTSTASQSAAGQDSLSSSHSTLHYSINRIVFSAIHPPIH